MNSKKSKSRLEVVKPELRCPLCGATEIETSIIPFSFEYGSGDAAAKLNVDVPLRNCDACDIEYLDEEGERIKHEAICQHLGVLSPREIRHIRKNCSNTRTSFAEITGLGEASLNRWENGLSIQTHANDRYLRLLDYPDNLRRLETFADSKARSHFENSVNSQFRGIQVTPRMRKEQQEFELPKAA